MSESISVFHADDHPLVRAGVRALLSTEADMDLVGEAADGAETVRGVLALRPDVILLDLHMPRKDGLQAIDEIKQALPDARILVVTSFADDADVFPAIRAGALGYLLKDSPPEDLLRAIRDVHAGRSTLDASLAMRVIQELRKPPDLPLTDRPLTQREVEILKLVAEGKTNLEIAEKVVVSERTVRTHVSNILGKLHLANRTQAALYALREGITSLDS